MKKEEIIPLHLQLAKVKKYCEEIGVCCDFPKYKDLGITPLQVHRSKDEHKQAIFVLGTELASMTPKDWFRK